MEVFTARYRVSSRDIDGQGQCKPSALLGYLQEAAIDSAEEGGFGRALEARCGAVWMMTRTMLSLSRPLRWRETLTLQTWHRGNKGAVMHRDYDLLVGSEPVGEAVSAWVLVHPDTGKIEKLSGLDVFRRNFGGNKCKAIRLNKIRTAGELTLVERRRLHYSDTDINGHVNNTRYADFACDALKLETRSEGEFVSRMRIGFLAQCWPGEELNLFVGENEQRRVVLGSDVEGKARFEAEVSVQPGSR